MDISGPCMYQNINTYYRIVKDSTADSGVVFKIFQNPSIIKAV